MIKTNRLKMKRVKVFFNGKRLRDMYPHATWFEVLKWKMYRLTRKAMILAFLLGLIVGAYKIGVSANEVTYAAPVIEIVEVLAKAPVLERIANCESPTGHYKDGQVVINKTQDIGKYQINVPIWGKKATEMGLNLAVEKDNETFARYLYENFGTEPWVHSKKCWNK